MAMKEIQPKYKDTVEVFAEKEISTSIIYMGSMRPHKGHKVFELDTKTGEIRLAEFEPIVVHFQQKGTPRRKIIIKKGCQYVSALNYRNAIKKFTK